MQKRILNLVINPNIVTQDKITTDDKLKRLLCKILDRFEKESIDRRYYRQINESERIFDRNYFTDEVRLRIEQGVDKISGKPNGMHAVEMFVRYPKSNAYSVQCIAYGSKSEVLKTLKNDSFIKDFVERVKFKSEKLEDVEF